jgi:hypothetical protein
LGSLGMNIIVISGTIITRVSSPGVTEESRTSMMRLDFSSMVLFRSICTITKMLETDIIHGLEIPVELGEAGDLQRYAI